MTVTATDAEVTEAIHVTQALLAKLMELKKVKILYRGSEGRIRETHLGEQSGDLIIQVIF